MNWKPKLTKRAEEPADLEALDPALKQALGDFKASVRGWSDAAYNRPRTAQSMVVRTLPPIAESSNDDKD